MGNLLCCVEVEESTVAMRERFGKFDGVMEPGCHFVPWFLGLQARGPLSLRLRQLEIRCPTKTKVTSPQITKNITLSYAPEFKSSCLQDDITVCIISWVRDRKLLLLL
jgi:hypothetical protein